ncbi:hypothetical protein H0H92_007418 [Tricholoma furcatifolium]|nr:hypothetical protein H0H92_007418 [Tricholoma furcatifolium]
MTQNDNHLSPVDTTDVTDVEASPRPSHVHFRPRVRITSGINRHRHASAILDDLDHLNGTCTPSSTVSGSPSSSISAPLHSRNDDEADKPGWGPLGQRVSLLARRARRGAGKERRKVQVRPVVIEQPSPCETTPLLRPRLQSPTIDADGHRIYDLLDSESEEEDIRRQSRAHEIDEAFGTMPQRLINRHEESDAEQ